MHARKLLRHAAKELLLGLPSTAARVEVGRTVPLPAQHAPTLLIYTIEESSNRDYDGNPASLGRTLQLFVDGRVCAPSPPDDLLDDIAEQVENRMRVDPTLGGLAFDSFLSATVSDTRLEGAVHQGGIRLEYRVRYAEPAEDED